MRPMSDARADLIADDQFKPRCAGAFRRSTDGLR
jgi:hypothetical protein